MVAANVQEYNRNEENQQNIMQDISKLVQDELANSPQTRRHPRIEELRNSPISKLEESFNFSVYDLLNSLTPTQIEKIATGLRSLTPDYFNIREEEVQSEQYLLSGFVRLILRMVLGAIGLKEQNTYSNKAVEQSPAFLPNKFVQGQSNQITEFANELYSIFNIQHFADYFNLKEASRQEQVQFFSSMVKLALRVVLSTVGLKSEENQYLKLSNEEITQLAHRFSQINFAARKDQQFRDEEEELTQEEQDFLNQHNNNELYPGRQNAAENKINKIAQQQDAFVSSIFGFTNLNAKEGLNSARQSFNNAREGISNAGESIYELGQASFRNGAQFLQNSQNFINQIYNYARLAYDLLSEKEQFIQQEINNNLDEEQLTNLVRLTSKYILHYLGLSAEADAIHLIAHQSKLLEMNEEIENMDEFQLSGLIRIVIKIVLQFFGLKEEESAINISSKVQEYVSEIDDSQGQQLSNIVRIVLKVILQSFGLKEDTAFAAIDQITNANIFSIFQESNAAEQQQQQHNTKHHFENEDADERLRHHGQQVDQEELKQDANYAHHMAKHHNAKEDQEEQLQHHGQVFNQDAAANQAKYSEKQDQEQSFFLDLLEFIRKENLNVTPEELRDAIDQISKVSANQPAFISSIFGFFGNNAPSPSPSPSHGGRSSKLVSDEIDSSEGDFFGNSIGFFGGNNAQKQFELDYAAQQQQLQYEQEQYELEQRQTELEQEQLRIQQEQQRAVEQQIEQQIQQYWYDQQFAN
ncbi:hypothetical protein CYY_002198 [Polysphondylium violaceum]|uniref:Uncharacterized protein n=1 Tax=Polysphondylium violaceum TaxID=133409 RepID=A0A8J4PZU5_9MYCE|nr:hypothetical protein CYY_002198 [Polysphondylium violaceum]